MSCADITYIPVQGGFLYLVAIMDWASRRVLAWRLSNTLDTEFCLAALAEALEMYGIPEIFNTDQGSQFTSIAFTEMLEAAGIRCSMDGRGRCLDGGAEARGWRALARLGEHGEDAQLSVGEQQLRRQVRQLPPEPDPAGFMGQGQRYGARELRDKRARARIAIRIDRVQEGNTTMCDPHSALGGAQQILHMVHPAGVRSGGGSYPQYAQDRARSSPPPPLPPPALSGYSAEASTSFRVDFSVRHLGSAPIPTTTAPADVADP